MRTNLISGSFGRDLGGLARDREALVGDRQHEVLAHLVLLTHGTDRKSDFGRTAERISFACYTGRDGAAIGRTKQAIESQTP